LAAAGAFLDAGAFLAGAAFFARVGAFLAGAGFDAALWAGGFLAPSREAAAFLVAAALDGWLVALGIGGYLPSGASPGGDHDPRRREVDGRPVASAAWLPKGAG
jgi:hypothetical protein